ncbi:Xanthan biosynthesis glycosyltransferase GumD [Arcticibacter svalbardensis MN12-7]|uniref:Xanthan biosynthesis glycosyltransferase GumD n=1 Tax=Arcticibacter svalbardensis MN12-7 TaxID=1150600 RepID=R9GV80_9SPHI|nr:undecaprenyl-phosphate glucose phosphotransferase [Arcticibacter svalbardensis]EOR95621.1 Xanthan biosynthesis glycosyltransferase GumD [Arcticibacter svalbardensis MN12-7]
MQTRYLYLLRFVLLATDIILINASFFFAFYAVFGIQAIPLVGSYKNYLLVCNLIWFFSSNVFGVYRNESLAEIVRIYRATWKAVAFHAVLFVFYLTFSDNYAISRAFILTLYLVVSLAFLLSRFAGTFFEFVLYRHFKVSKPVAVLGKNNTGLRLAGYLEECQNFKFEGFLHNDEEDTLFVGEDGSLLPSTCKHIADAASRGIKDVYVSLTPDRMVEAKYLLEEAERQCVRLKFVPDLTGSLTAPFTMSYMGEFPVISLRHEPLENMQNRFRKRIFDIVFSSLVMIFVMSWLVPIIGIIIKIQSKGPIFFRQLRSGRNNEPFWCYKFRSMKVNNDSDRKQARKDDDRITPIGKFLRKSSLDEFPQFFNVLMGSMSIIGPRPHMIKHTEQYSAIIDRYMVRQFLKPGISGWAQVNGFRGETEDPRLMEKRVEHDIRYMENWSSMLDVKIVFMTVINMFKGEDNAY